MSATLIQKDELRVMREMYGTIPIRPVSYLAAYLNYCLTIWNSDRIDSKRFPIPAGMIIPTSKLTMWPPKREAKSPY
jgi:hypothetical protein